MFASVGSHKHRLHIDVPLLLGWWGGKLFEALLV